MRPDWKRSPDWARWAAQGADGRWFWYEKKPSRRLRTFANSGQGQAREAYKLEMASWEDSLEARPDGRG